MSPDEKVQDKKIKNREILHKNTRFQITPFDEQQSQRTIHEAASVQALYMQGKIGVDGKEILPQESPKVNGYGFTATPSPAPGKNEEPKITLLDASQLARWTGLSLRGAITTVSCSCLTTDLKVICVHVLLKIV